MKTIAIAGASGFIGKHLINQILKDTDFKILALSRSDKESKLERVSWRKCDLFSVLDIEKAISGADYLIYLVHSMQPSAHLDQASFSDYDLILADNFGRAARKLGITNTIYLGGLIPKEKELSTHLQSRLEVEQALAENIENYTFIRAGLILGYGGSSFHILLNLVRRLPILICPRWTRNKTSPIHIDQVTRTIVEILRLGDHKKKIYDLASKDSMSYLDVLKLTAKELGLKRIFINFPVSLIYLSRLWVSLISGASRMLVYPLVESLKHTLNADPVKKYQAQTFEEYSVQKGIHKSVQASLGKDYKFSTRRTKRKTVRSVQRAVLPKGYSARDIAELYMHWLPKFLYPFIIVTIDNQWVTFSFLHKKLKLLVLKWSPERSTTDRQLFYIKGGLLAAKQDRGRLEFREVLNGTTTLSAIHDFHPALPWYIYRYTQAVVHLIVMHFFGRYLKSLSIENNKGINHE